MRGSRDLYGKSILDILEVYKRSVKVTAENFVIFTIRDYTSVYNSVCKLV
jgi:hypothetical protein